MRFRPFRMPLAVIALLFTHSFTQAQTFTLPSGTGVFSNAANWNFGGGTLPVPGTSASLTVQNFGSSTTVTANTDYNFTLNTLNLVSRGGSSSTVTLGSINSGNLAFAGAGSIQTTGSGGTSTVSSQVAISTLATGAGLTLNANHMGNLTISGAIVSNNSSAAGLTINSSSTVPNAGIIILSGTNIFTSPVTLTAGNFAPTSAGAIGVFGSTINTLTIGGGTLQSSTTLLNPIVANTDVIITGSTNSGTFGAAGGLGVGGISGAGGLQVRPGGLSVAQIFNVANTYNGATVIGQPVYALTTAGEAAGILRVNSAAGTILNTSSFTVADGGILEINKSGGDSINNARIATGTAINISSGFLQVIGSSGISTQAAGTVNAGGLTTILANTQAAAGSTTVLNINNLARTGAGTVAFAGGAGTGATDALGLGNTAAVAGITTANINLTAINGLAPSTALVGGSGAANTTTISIIPWAVGDRTITGSNFATGTGFVTYGPSGVRLLLPTAAEYNIANNFTAVAATENMRITGAITNPIANTTINSLFIASTAQTLAGGANTVTITSGALAASNVALFTTSSPILFGAGGTGEAIISTISALTTIGSTTVITANGALTASTLTKSGHGTLNLGSTANAFSSNLITINAGFIQVDDLTKLGIANSGSSSIVVNGHSFLSRAGFSYSGTTAATLNVPITINTGHAHIGTNNATATLNVDGVISGAGGANFNNIIAGSTINVRGDNTYTGGTRLGGTAGTTVVLTGSTAVDKALGNASGTVTIDYAGGTLRLAGNWTTTRNIGLINNLGVGTTISQDGFDTAGFNSTWGGAILGSSTIFKTDSNATPGTWTITSANNPYTGTINIGTSTRAGGTLAFSGAGDLNAAPITFGQAVAGVAGTYAVNYSAATGPGAGTPWRTIPTLTTSTTFAQAHSIQLGSTSGTPVDLRIGAGTFGTSTASGSINGFGTLVKTGGGTLTLATANAFQSPTPATIPGVEIWGGILQVSNNNQLGAAGNFILIQHGMLEFITTGSTYSRNITLSRTPLSLVNSTGPFNGLQSTVATTISGNITGTGGFNKTGTLGLLLTGTNNFTGNVRIGAGLLGFQTAAGLGNSTQIILTAGTLSVDVGAAAPISLNQNLHFTASASLDNSSTQPLTLNGQVISSTTSGTNPTVTFSTLSTGGVTFTANNPYFYGTLNSSAGGVIALTGSGQFPRGIVTLGSSATAFSSLDQTNLSREFGSLNLGINGAQISRIELGATGVLETGFLNATQTWDGSIFSTGGSSAGVVRKFGVGTTTITSSLNTFTGGFHLLGGATTMGAATVSTGNIPLQAAFTVGGIGDTFNFYNTSLTLVNTSATADRIANTQDVYLNNSRLVMTTNTTTASTEVAQSLNVSGYSVLELTTGGTLNFSGAAGLNRVNRGTILIRGGGASFGTAAATTAIGNVLFGNSGGTLIGGTGTPVTEVPILPFIVSADSGSAGSTGNTFVTYGANGIRPLNTGTEYLTTFTGANSNSNVRFGTTTTIAADVNLNSWIITGTANSVRYDSTTTEKIIVNSGAIANTITQVFGTPTNTYTVLNAGIQVAELQTGLSNSRELIVHTLGANLQISSLISTSGGLTKSGAGSGASLANGILYLTNPANTYTGGTTVNGGQLVVDTLGSINDSATQTLTLSGGFFQYRGPAATLQGPVVLGGGSANNPGSTGGLFVNPGTTLTVGTNITGFGGLSKDGTGTLILGGTNSFSGNVIIQAGDLQINSAAALGNASRVIFGTTNVSSNGGGSLRFGANMTLTQDFWTSTSAAAVGTIFDTNGFNVTLTGNMSAGLQSGSNRGLTKLGTGDLTLTAANNYNGATGIFGGNLILGGANGSILATNGTGGYTSVATISLFPSGGLVLDNSTTVNNNRLPDVFSIATGGSGDLTTMMRFNGGELKLIGNSTTAVSEVTNRLDHFLGNITLINNGRNVTLTAGRLNRTDNLSIGLFRGDNLGATVSNTSTNIFLIDLGSGSTQLSGAGGAIGTPFVNIIPGIIGDTSSTGNGSDLTTYDANVGIRPLTSSEYTTTIPTLNYDQSRAPNVLVSATTIAPSTTSWISALKMTAGSTLNGSATINVFNSTILATGNSTINVPVLNSTGNAGYDIYTAGSGTTLTLNSSLAGVKLYKAGAGTLLFGGAYYGGGSTSTNSVLVAEGTLTLNGANAFLNPQVNLLVSNGATFNLGGADRTIGNVGPVTGVNVNGVFQFGVRQDGTVALGGNKLTLFNTASNLYTGDITGTASSELIKATASTGTTTFTEAVAMAGTVRIFGGGIQLAGRGTMVNAAGFDIRGGTLTLNNSIDAGRSGTYIPQRISATAPISLAGVLTVTANPEAIADHGFGTLTLTGSGTLNATSGSLSSTTLTFANISNTANKGVLNISGTNLGLPKSPIGNTRVLATQINGGTPASALIGGGGANGTTSVNILPWAFSGSSYYTYGANGFRLLETTTSPEYDPSITAGASVNVRTTALATLAANTTVNSLIVTSGNIAGAFDLTVSSGAVANTIGSTIGVNTNALLTGASNTRDLYVFASGATILNYNVTTSGALVKYGTSDLTLGGTNTYAGGTYIHGGTLTYTNDNQLGAAGTAVTMGLPAMTNTASLVYNGTNLVLDFNRPITLNGFGGLTSNVSNSVVAFNQPISGSGGLALPSSGIVYEFNSANSYTGETNLFFGILSIQNDSSLGNGGPLKFNDVSTQGIFLRGNWTTSRQIYSTGSTLINLNGFDATINSPLIGSAGIAVNGNGTLTFTSPNTYASTLTVNAGVTRLRDRGAFSNSATITMGFGTKLTLDDTGTHFSDRLADNGTTITLNNSHLEILGNASVTTEEVINSTTSSAGFTTFTVQPGSGQAAILRYLGTFGRSSGSAFLFRGNNLGVNAPGTADTGSMLLFNLIASTSLTGGGGAAGTTYMSIVPGAFVDTTNTGLGTQLATYDLANGIRALTSSEYANGLTNGVTMQDNVQINSAVTGINAATTINALWMNSGSLTGTGVITITAGSILATGSSNTITAPISAGTNALAFGGSGNVTVATAISSVSTGGLVKTGAGELTLNAANLYTGTTTIAAGTVNAGIATAFNATTVRFLGGTIANTSGAPLTITNALALSGTMTVGGTTATQNVTFSGTVSLESATRAISVTNANVTATYSGIISQSATSGVGGIGLTKTGAGTLILTGNNTYGNSTTNTSGGWYESVTTINAGELQVNGQLTTNSGTGGSRVVVNNTGTLGGTGRVIPTQGSTARNTVAVNSGGTISPGAGAVGTLTIGNATTPGTTDATVTLASGSFYRFEYTGAQTGGVLVNSAGSATAGTGNDLLAVNGVLTNNGVGIRFVGNFSDFTLYQQYSYRIATQTANYGNSSYVPTIDTTQFAGFVGFDSITIDTATGNNTVYVNFVPVPEPTTILGLSALGLGAAGFLRRRLRKAA